MGLVKNLLEFSHPRFKSAHPILLVFLDAAAVVDVVDASYVHAFSPFPSTTALEREVRDGNM